jgi:hypothetical protein
MKKILWVLLVVDLIVVNFGVGYLIYKTQVTYTSPVPSPTVGEGQREVQKDTCGPDCQKYIDGQIASLAAEQAVAPQPTSKPVIITKTIPKVKTRTVNYVTIPGTGSTTFNDWQDLSGTEFYFDTNDYPGLLEIYFEANMKLFNGNGLAYVRLFDANHSIGVQGSEISTNGQDDTVITSGQVTFWSGKNLIRVQAKSLTADTAIFNYGRLKITTEN